MLKTTILAAAIAISGMATAQEVKFPQLLQPGAAQSTTNSDGTEFRLSNNLLTASFKATDGKLLFDGCPELGLNPGTEIFYITLGDGTRIASSEMQMTSCGLIDLSADPESAVASGRYPGKALDATFVSGDLSLHWQAILRDGSHYIRTSLQLSASSDVAMKSVTPMWYEINADAAPEIVGNTRGAILASSSLFAGLETPTGINSVESAAVNTNTVAADAGFTYNAWSADTSGDEQPDNPAYWTWVPDAETPAGILSLGFASSDIHGKRGFVAFSTAGTHTATFQYLSGTHGLNVVGVDLVDSDGTVVASDYHVGFTGGASTNNTYTLSVRQAGTYLVRYFVETRTETVTARGSITWSPSVTAASGNNSIETDSGFLLNGWSADTTNDYYEGIVSNPSYWTWAPGGDTPSGITSLGFADTYIRGKRGFLRAASSGDHTVTFQYQSGSHGLNVVGVDLVDSKGNVVASDYHVGFTGGASTDNTYTLSVPRAGTYLVRYFIEVRTETVTSTGTVTWNPSVTTASGFDSGSTEGGDSECQVKYIKGLWSRSTTLAAGKSWTISAVAGLIAPDQARRSVLAYSERERAVPWRPFPLYNSWYELNIDRNNSATYDGHMTADDCTAVVEEWKTNLFDVYNTPIKAFVWDDGWDEYGTWAFNKGFPNGFKEPYELAESYGVGTGAWLGPVGGYGTSGEMRRAYWTDKGGMQLSNPAYYKVFLDACQNMVDKYDFCFFKLDGISAQFSSVGPDAGTTGEENAEGIIDILQAVRQIRPDMFFNTTVGTWASPFWFHYTDAVWRQEGDFGTVGNQGTDRERWITYRDRLVYQNFVQNSPLCPINTLMTHGVILTEYGDVAKNMDYAGIVREIRCAFACGSGMVELYCDSKLMNSINSGALWGDLADCIKWQQRNTQVLPDAHWVGGNPWDGSRANVYGWAAWNGDHATLALRNPSTSTQTYTFTLREALDIPAYFTSDYRLTKAFADQAALTGLTEGSDIGLDTRITVQLPGSSVYVFDGQSSDSLSAIGNVAKDETGADDANADRRIFDLQGRQHNDSGHLNPGIYIQSGKKFISR